MMGLWLHHTATRHGESFVDVDNTLCCRTPMARDPTSSRRPKGKHQAHVAGVELQEPGHEKQKADVEASAPALGHSHRSRKRQMKQAASQAPSQESTPGKRRRREYERLLDYTHAISSHASQHRGLCQEKAEAHPGGHPGKRAERYTSKEAAHATTEVSWLGVCGGPCSRLLCSCTPYPVC